MKMLRDKYPKSIKGGYGSGGVADPNSGAWVHTDVGVDRGKTKNAEAHTYPNRYGMGEYRGRGMKNAMGRMRGDSSVGYRPVNHKQLGTSPRSTV